MLNSVMTLQIVLNILAIRAIFARGTLKKYHVSNLNDEYQVSRFSHPFSFYISNLCSRISSYFLSLCAIARPWLLRR